MNNNYLLLLIGAAIMSTLIGFPKSVAYTYPQCPLILILIGTAAILTALLLTANRLMKSDCDEVTE